MKKSVGKANLAPRKHSDMELDFTLSRAGLGTHRKNCAEKARLDNKIRSLDLMRRRSLQIHEDELKEIQQRLAPGAGGPRGSSLTTPRLGDDSGGELLVPGGDLPPSWSRMSGRRGSVQPDSPSPFSISSSSSSASSYCQKVEPPSSSSSSLSPSSSSPSVLTLALPPARRRRPSVVLQDLSSPPPGGQARQSEGDSHDNGGGVPSQTAMTCETIIDLLATGNGAPLLRTRKGSTGVLGAEPAGGAGAGAGAGQDETGRVDDARGATVLITKTPAGSFLRGPRTDAGAPGTTGAHRRGGRRTDGSGDVVPSGVGGLDLTNIGGETPRAVRGAERRPSDEAPPGGGSGAGGAEPRALRGRRASLDVGVANLSLLSPPCRSPGGNPSRLSLRRSSCASSQGTDLSTPSTPDSKSRESTTVFTFPPVTPQSNNNNTSGTTNNAWCSPRHSHVARSRAQLQRSLSSDGLIPPTTSPASRRNSNAIPAAASPPLRHRRNSSLKLPRMHGGPRAGGGARKQVTPCVNRMLLLHSVMQNSSVFQSADLEEGRL